MKYTIIAGKWIQCYKLWNTRFVADCIFFFTRAAKPWLSSSSSFEMFHEFTSSYPHLFTATAEKTCISEISAMSCIQLYGEWKRLFKLCNPFLRIVPCYNNRFKSGNVVNNIYLIMVIMYINTVSKWQGFWKLEQDRNRVK